MTQIIREVDNTERDTYLKNKNKTSKKDEDKKMIYTTRYSPYIKTRDIKALKLHWDIIENNTVLAAQFPQKPTITYRRNKNLKDTLIKTKMNIANNVATLDVQVRTKTKESQKTNTQRLFSDGTDRPPTQSNTTHRSKYTSHFPLNRTISPHSGIYARSGILY